jgi:hypothetical protein
MQPARMKFCCRPTTLRPPPSGPFASDILRTGYALDSGSHRRLWSRLPVTSSPRAPWQCARLDWGPPTPWYGKTVAVRPIFAAEAPPTRAAGAVPEQSRQRDCGQPQGYLSQVHTQFLRYQFWASVSAKLSMKTQTGRYLWHPPADDGKQCRSGRLKL